MEIRNRSDAEFETLVIRMLKEQMKQTRKTELESWLQRVF